jgi:O-antigen biosynthesis protein
MMTDKQTLAVNSPAWWNDYFQSQWETNGGRLQSQLFMQALLDNLPAEERHWLAQENRTVCDWGCAMGDGTAIIASRYAQAHIWGVDSSNAAIASAKQYYPDIAFVDDWSHQTVAAVQFDAVICSNCLEHFSAPLDVLQDQLSRCTSLHITMVPYAEHPREDSHCVSFDEKSFPQVFYGFTRINQSVVEVDKRAWPNGRQLLIIYASAEYVRQRRVLSQSVAEKAKWDAIYESMPIVGPEGDQTLAEFNSDIASLVKPLLPDSGSILEAGCGGGEQSLFLAKQAGYEVSLLDFSANALKHAEKLFELHGLQVNTIEADAFTKGKAEFDLVFNAGVLEHYSLDQQIGFLRGMASRSRRFVMVLVPNSACDWYWMWRVKSAGAGKWPYGREVPQSSLQDAFEGAGLRYVGQAFVGDRWTRHFIEDVLEDSPEALQQALMVHNAKISPEFNRNYLMVALGVVAGADGVDALPAPWHSGQVLEHRSAADASAYVADALSSVIASQNAVQIFADQLESLQSRYDNAANQISYWQEHAHKKEADAKTEAERLEGLLAHEQQVASVEIHRLNVALQNEQKNAHTEFERLQLLLAVEQKNADTEFDRLKLILQAEVSSTESLRSALDLSNLHLSTASQWVRRVDRQPWRFAAKKSLRSILKSSYQVLPLPIGVKQKIKHLASRLISRISGINLQTYPEIRVPNGPIREELLAPLDKTEDAARIKRKINANVAIKTAGKPDVLVFAVIDWHFRTQRPQHLARGFAERGHRVFYISNQFIDAFDPGYTLERLDTNGRLHQIKLTVSGTPAIYFAPPTSKDETMVSNSLALLMQDMDIRSSIALIQHAYWQPMAWLLPNSIRIYDCMDHHEGFGNVPEKLIKLEHQMLRQTDLVVASSTWLEEFAKSHNSQVAVVRNAADVEHFKVAPNTIYSDPAGRKTIGYIGAIAEWFDIELVRSVARGNPEARVLLVGNDTVQASRALADEPNIEFTGEVPYAKLPYYLHAFDVCLLPFKIIPLTQATNPVKVYEYLAAQKSVVSVALPEMVQFNSLIKVSSTAQDFVEAVTSELSKPLDLCGELAIKRLEFAQLQSWSYRIDSLLGAVDALRWPKISVIVLTYNNLVLTQACISSILSLSDYPNLELIIVDNASSDGTPDWLTTLQVQHPPITIILNKSNLGFAAGNNVGLRHANGDYLVMLNNDTVVTEGWVRTMLRHFVANPKLGLLGPVTDNIGNEAKIDIHYDNMLDMPQQAWGYCCQHFGKCHGIKTLAFFCVMMPKEVFEKIGELDEKFGLGFFEDDDYCRRTFVAGYQIKLAEDVFVHHHLSASFNKLPSEDRQQLFDENKKYFESKWGAWKPHAYR